MTITLYASHIFQLICEITETKSSNNRHLISSPFFSFSSRKINYGQYSSVGLIFIKVIKITTNVYDAL
ncbi:hypothetical protein HanIR_Chr14g0676191 [Helianthus annuus]|nr:hypothetical protein HanIR_Chr14g0676191 [Helianthus annuus]